MAYISTTRTGHPGLADRLAGLVNSVKQAMQRRRIFNQTARELNALSSRDLADLGIHRSMITRIALEAAYGN